MGTDLASVATLSSRLAEAEDLDLLLDVALSSMAQLWGFEHVMLLVAEEGCERLVTLASRGYDRAGVGSEVVFGVGIIGVTAARRTPVRIGSVRYAMRYARATQGEAARDGDTPAREIPLPGLPDADSQLSVPMLAQGRLIGVICVESPEQGAFDERHERCLSVAANQIGAGIALGMPERERTDLAGVDAQPLAPEPGPGRVLHVRYYHEDGSVFLDGEYLIKSLPGRILWRLLVQYREEGRLEFSNRELRLDATLALPPVKDNLETRLILLRRRLEERDQGVRMVKAGRGRFRLELALPFDIEEVPAP